MGWEDVLGKVQAREDRLAMPAPGLGSGVFSVAGLLKATFVPLSPK